MDNRKKSFWCKHGWHRWYIIEHRTNAGGDAWLYNVTNRICIRKGCGEEDNRADRFNNRMTRQDEFIEKIRKDILNPKQEATNADNNNT